MTRRRDGARTADVAAGSGQRARNSAPAPAPRAAGDHHALLQLQRTAGNRAAQSVVQRFVFKKPGAVFGALWSSEITVKQDLPESERSLWNRRSRVVERWDQHVKEMQKEEQKSLRDDDFDSREDSVRRGLEELRTTVVWIGDHASAAQARAKLKALGSELQWLEDAVARHKAAAKQVEQARSRREKRAELTGQAESAITRVTALSGSDHPALDEVTRVKDYVDTKFAGLMDRLRAAATSDDRTYNDVAAGLISSYTAHAGLLDAAEVALARALEEIRNERKNVAAALDALDKGVAGVRGLVDDLDGFVKVISDIHTEVAPADLTHFTARAKAQTRLVTLQETLSRAFTDAVAAMSPSRTQAANLLMTFSTSARRVTKVIENAQPTADASALQQHQSTLTGLMSDLGTTHSKVATMLAAPAQVLQDQHENLKLFRHLLNPPRTTRSKERVLSPRATAPPPSVVHDGRTYDLIRNGTNLYGHLVPTALSAYPGAVPLFTSALETGLISMKGTGSSGVKYKDPRFEIKVRRTTLEAHELPRYLRVDNSLAPATVDIGPPEGPQKMVKCIVFDHARRAH